MVMSFSLIPTMDKMNVLITLQRAYPTLEQLGLFPACCGSISMRVGEYEPSSFYFGINHDIDKHPSSSFPYHPEFIFVDQDGFPCETSSLTPSKEVELHAKIYRFTGCAVILHVHTTMNYWISHTYHEQSYVSLDQNEMMLSTGLCQRDVKLHVPILPQPEHNHKRHTQDYTHPDPIMGRIATVIHPDIPVLLQHQHGVYIWGNTITEAVRRFQAFEFACQLKYTCVKK